MVVLAILGITMMGNKASKASNKAIREALLSENLDLSDTEQEGISYVDYLKRVSDGQLIQNQKEFMVSGSDYIDTTYDNPVVTDDGTLVSQEEGSVSYSLDVENEGLYYIEVGYCPSANSSAAIQRSLQINGTIPFVEATDMVFDRMWQDETKDYLMVTDQNQSVPSQVQVERWGSKRLEAFDKTVTGPFMFYMEQGQNVLTLISNGGTMQLSYIKLIPADGLMSYESYLRKYEEQQVEKINSSDIDTGAIIVQAEDAYTKTHSMLIPQNDRTSSQTKPYDPSNIVLNTIGGASWKEVGTGITWKVDVPKTGLYQIATRFLQAENRDFYSIRELKINGAIPFEEAAAIKFNYGSKFQVDTIGDEQGAYYFFLEEGENEITMTVSMGDLSYAYAQTSISVRKFNDLYRKLTSVMGSSPDGYRDYKITTSIPEFVDVLKLEYYRLTTVMESLGESLGSNGKTTEIAKLLYQLEGIIDQPDRIAKELSYFNSNITAVSEWMLSLGEQPLQLDYLMICGEGSKLPKAEDNIIEFAVHNMKAFVGSFTNDYKFAATESTETKTDIEVWIATTTRDQYDIAQRLVSKAFDESDIRVTLKMVNADTVMPATLTGNGPDVALQLNYTMPTNFAYRNAAYDLTQFTDFEEVANQFAPGAMTYFEYNDGVYGLPDEMSFPVMYYRKDILDSLGLDVPNTWDELTALLPYLQSENMQAYFVTTGHTILGGSSSTSTKPVNAIFLSMLYQNGEALYNDGGVSTNLESKGSLFTFKQWTEFYTKQSFATSMNVVTRFRTGECPIIIEDYTYMNAIQAAAPEIEGAWSIAPIPGTYLEDGGLRRDTACMVSGAMMLKNSVEKKHTEEAAWEFLKWWVSEETQTTFASEQEALLGSAGQFPVANISSLETLANKKGISEEMIEISRWLTGMDQVPGGYITGRSVENAFLTVVSDNTDPVDTLYNQLRFINNELKNKRQEFGLENE